jgi:hypothetical protein
MTPSALDTSQGFLGSARNLFGRDKGNFTASSSMPSSDVSLAFSLGWEMSVIYLEERLTGTGRRVAPGGDRLPSLSRLSASERSLVRIDQIRGIAIHFHDSFRAAGVKPLPQTDGVEDLINAGSSRAEIQLSLDALHMSLLRALSAINPRLAKAYRLGVSMATACRLPHDKQSLEREFDRHRLANFGEWLADLASLFPAHSSRAVRLSLSAWRRWVDNPQINPVEAKNWLDSDVGTVRRIGRAAQAQAKGSEPLDWKTQGDPVIRTLRRQGEVWRALLSGEKRGEAMLELPDYVDAAVQTLRRMVWLLRGALIPILVALMAFLVGVFVLFHTSETGKLLAGVATVTGALGFTWKGTLGAISRVTTDLEHPVWGAELDDGIGRAITQLPPGAVFDWKEPKDAAPASGPPPALHQITVERPFPQP